MTASYGDWILRCELAANNERSCEVAQTIQDQRGQLLTHLTICRAAAGEWTVTVHVKSTSLLPTPSVSSSMSRLA
jgi:invasion protein IalB